MFVSTPGFHRHDTRSQQALISTGAVRYGTHEAYCAICGESRSDHEPMSSCEAGIAATLTHLESLDVARNRFDSEITMPDRLPIDNLLGDGEICGHRDGLTAYYGPIAHDRYDEESEP